MTRLNHHHIISVKPFISLIVIELIIYKHFCIPIYLTIFNIIRLEIKVTAINIVRRSSANESISNSFIYFPQLPLFPITCKSLEANPGDFFALRGEHVLQKIFLERFLLVKMTLMKGAEVI